MLSPGRARLALLALALGGFGIGCTEFVAMGLLPDIARDLLPELYTSDPEQAIAQAGALISAYAAGVVVGAPTIGVFAARFSRKRLLIVLAAWFALGSIASALLPSFGLVFAARFLAALPHGAYFGVASLVAANLLGPGNRGKAAAYVLGGLTIANVVGVPAITFLGQHAGWRSAYLAVATVFVLTTAALVAALPAMKGDPSATSRGELRAFTIPQVWFALGIGAIGFGGFFAAYSYVAPIATEVAGLPEWSVPLLLVCFGIGMTIGNFAGGAFVDRGVRRAVLVSFVGVLASLGGLLAFATIPPLLFLFVLLIGVSSSALSPAIQVRLMDVARGSQTIAAAVNHSALNIGNGMGAYLGGVTIAAGFGYLSPIVVGLLVTAAGLVLALVAFAVDRRPDAPPVTPHTAPIPLPAE
ncbi:MFS transporter [Herbiconiux sp. L3-i23]|uniref:MFS transporter n=1 Tax=Herbiconiux sp. L3-i23 TaxID=2905871 RepID=UPI0020618AED|nr:MFS transporter [Herbiconiux sp. L3-i23]BDI23302.1 MFS transporter [Herbiconiux sp. L3-i23]